MLFLSLKNGFRQKKINLLAVTSLSYSLGNTRRGILTEFTFKRILMHIKHEARRQQNLASCCPLTILLQRWLNCSQRASKTTAGHRWFEAIKHCEILWCMPSHRLEFKRKKEPTPSLLKQALSQSILTYHKHTAQLRSKPSQLLSVPLTIIQHF